MGYNIEVSFDLTKHANVSELKRTITDRALDMNCDHYYYIYEMERDCRIPRNHCIIVVNYDDDFILQCSNFIKQMKQMKGVHIECIYDDIIACKLVYASQHYLTTIDKDKVIKYNKFKRERSYSDNEKIILELIDKK